MTESLRDKVVWVTGAGKGLGRAVAAALIGAGATVVATARSHDDLHSLAAEHPPGRVVVAPGSVTDENDIDRIAGQLAGADTRSLDGLVNCAGISPSFVRSERLDVGIFRDVLATNTVGAFLCARAAARIMLDRPGGGSIVNISSVHAHVGYPRIAAYAASKGAIAALTATLAVEWADRGVRVNAIAPGYFRTDLSRGLLDSGWGKDVLRRIPMGRTGQPHELGQATVYLLSDQSSYVTGTTINIDGGWQAW
jgi:NAD(P)-dependent dehydrogenase (short-subunit alcohol dehydrogenase family)